MIFHPRQLSRHLEEVEAGRILGVEDDRRDDGDAHVDARDGVDLRGLVLAEREEVDLLAGGGGALVERFDIEPFSDFSAK